MPSASAGDRRVLAVLEHMRLLGVILDPAGRILFANAFLLELTGWTREEVIGTDWFDRFLAPEVREQVRPIYLHNITQGTVRPNSQNVVMTRDGRRRTIHWNSTVLRAPDGSVDSVAAIGEDVTDRELAQDALRESWASTSAALDATVETVAIFRPVLDEAGRFVDAEIRYLNDIARRRWLPGAPMEELAGRRLFEIAPRIRPLIEDVWGPVVETGVPFRGLREFEMADGRRTFDLAVTPYEGGFVHVGRDVTDEHLAVAALRGSEERLRRTIAGLDAVVGFQERPGGELVLSPQVESFLGVPPEAIRDLDAWRALVHPDDVERCVTVWSGDQASWELEYRMRHADGGWRWVADRGRRFRDGPDGEAAMFGVIVDITAQRALEAQLRQAQRLEAVGQLAGGIAHDFNNLLAGIRGYVELARESLKPGDAAREDLDEALAAADRAAALTRQLLLFSRDRGQAPDAVIDPVAVIAPLAPMLRRLLGEHIELVETLDEDAGTVRMDASQLEQVVVNLAVNARDAMQDGGTLRIGVRRLSSAGGPMVRLTVMDSGSGMDEATLGRVFDPFFTTKEPGKGTGLGLATVHAIVRRAGGVIDVTSTPGHGTLFRIDLPAVEAAPAGSIDSAPPPVPPSGAGEVVLLVEDDAAVRSVLTRILRAGGYEVLAASSGMEAMDIVAAWGSRIDLLVSDVRMPRMQGPELARRVRASQPGLPILFISAYSAELDPAVLDLPDVRLLDKPFDMETFRASVRAAIDRAHAG